MAKCTNNNPQFMHNAQMLLFGAEIAYNERSPADVLLYPCGASLDLYNYDVQKMHDIRKIPPLLQLKSTKPRYKRKIIQRHACIYSCICEFVQGVQLDTWQFVQGVQK